jgi:8-oxo-dGTP diphosphatase
MVKVNIKLVVFTIIDRKLMLYFPDNQTPISTVPGEALDSRAVKIFQDHFSIKPNEGYLEQLYTFEKIEKKETVIDIVYFILVSADTMKRIEMEKWIEYKKISSRHPDIKILDYAVQRLRWKVEYTNVIFSLLTNRFTLSELQETYEAVLDKKLDKRNFRKKILSLGLIKSTRKYKQGFRARPALLYQASSKKPTIVKVLS